jgi:hypothetical protein
MKQIVHALAVLLLTNALPAAVNAQCAGGSAAYTLSYDTMTIGNGNASRTFSFPKFNPSLGTLISIDIHSNVGLEYSYDLENQTAVAKLLKTKIVRTDDVYSIALDPFSISGVNQTPQVSSLIPAHQLVSFGPAKMSYAINNNINDGRMVNFMGVGTVDFDYETSTSASVQGPLPWQLTFTSVSDTTRFGITYNYCSTSLLSSDLLYFNARLLKGQVALTWRQSAGEPGRIYEVQMSTNLQQFTTIGSVTENPTGQYSYTWLSNSSRKLYFRIQEKNANGTASHSAIRMVEAAQAEKALVKIYPTIYTGGTLNISLPFKANWQVNFLSVDGRRISQTLPADAYTAAIALPPAVSNGIYAVEVINTKSQEKLLTRIVVQR